MRLPDQYKNRHSQPDKVFDIKRKCHRFDDGKAHKIVTNINTQTLKNINYCWWKKKNGHKATASGSMSG